MLGARILRAGIPLMQLTSIPELGKSPGVTPWISRKEENAAITDLQAANFQLCAPGGGLCAQSGKPVALPKLFVLQFPPKFQGADVGTDGTEPPRQLLPSAEPPPSPLPTKVQWEKPTGIQDRSLHHFFVVVSEPQTRPGVEGLHKIPTLSQRRLPGISSREGGKGARHEGSKDLERLRKTCGNNMRGKTLGEQDGGKKSGETRC